MFVWNLPLFTLRWNSEKVPTSFRQLSAQSWSLQIVNRNVCFRRKRPCGFLDRAQIPLMTATGWRMTPCGTFLQDSLRR